MQGYFPSYDWVHISPANFPIGEHRKRHWSSDLYVHSLMLHTHLELGKPGGGCPQRRGPLLWEKTGYECTIARRSNQHRSIEKSQQARTFGATLLLRSAPMFSRESAPWTSATVTYEPRFAFNIGQYPLWLCEMSERYKRVLILGLAVSNTSRNCASTSLGQWIWHFHIRNHAIADRVFVPLLLSS